jgi:hypothetical protein
MFHLSVKPVMIHRADTAFWLADESSPASIRRLVLFLDDQMRKLAENWLKSLSARSGNAKGAWRLINCFCNPSVFSRLTALLKEAMLPR